MWCAAFHYTGAGVVDIVWQCTWARACGCEGWTLRSGRARDGYGRRTVRFEPLTRCTASLTVAHTDRRSTAASAKHGRQRSLRNSCTQSQHSGAAEPLQRAGSTTAFQPDTVKAHLQPQTQGRCSTANCTRSVATRLYSTITTIQLVFRSTVHPQLSTLLLRLPSFSPPVPSPLLRLLLPCPLPSLGARVVDL